jgi:hypothetical protein
LSGLLPHQMRMENVCKKVVIAIPLALVKASGGTDEGESAVHTLVELLEEAGAENDSRLRWGM